MSISLGVTWQKIIGGEVGDTPLSTSRVMSGYQTVREISEDDGRNKKVS